MDIKTLKKELYHDVSKPARYMGGELNQPDMDKPCSVRGCICFPDTYEIGMSNLGVRILYGMANEKENCVLERCFAPWVDLIEKLEKTGERLRSIETAKPLAEFDFLGFSLQYELCYTNVLMMLDLAGIPHFARDRGEEYPIIMAGGPCMANPEPVAEFFDLLMVGEGEEMFSQVIDLVDACKKEGATKAEFLSRARSIRGVIIPSLDKPIYSGDKITGFTRTVKKAVVQDLDKAYFPVKPLVPNVEAVHDRAVLELYRGCANGCRYCQAGFYYRPIRQKKAETLIAQGTQMIKSSGFQEMSLSSLSTGDYREIEGLISGLKPVCDKRKVHLSLPSMRVDSFKGLFASEARLSSLTFAPEAGTQRLRDVINKNVTDEDVESTVRAAFEMGFTSVKLYFMMGLPTETDEDLMGIRDMVCRIKDIYREVGVGEKALRISVSVNTFIPKPVTPFQWERLITKEEIESKQKLLRDALRIKGVTYSWNDAENSFMEGVFSRGDRRLANVIERAYRLGAKYDGWTEYMRYDLWQQAFETEGISMDEYLVERSVDEILPHEYIDCGVPRQYFIRERQRAYEGIRTESCKKACRGCGASSLGECDQW